MIYRPITTHPQLYARSAGALYLAVILLGGFAEGFVTDRLIVPGDAFESAEHILHSPGLWQIGVGADLLVAILAVAQLWIEYLLLRPVSKSLVLLAVLFNVVSLAVESVSKLFLLLVLPALANTNYLHAFTPQQLQVLADLAYRAHGIAFNIALIFFGFACLVNGYLIFRSGYLPRLIGALLQIAGVSYLIACFAALFAPELANLISPVILLPALIGESSVCLWLLIKGVNVARWMDRTRANLSP